MILFVLHHYGSFYAVLIFSFGKYGITVSFILRSLIYGLTFYNRYHLFHVSDLARTLLSFVTVAFPKVKTEAWKMKILWLWCGVCC